MKTILPLLVVLLVVNVVLVNSRYFLFIFYKLEFTYYCAIQFNWIIFFCRCPRCGRPNTPEERQVSDDCLLPLICNIFHLLHSISQQWGYIEYRFGVNVRTVWWINFSQTFGQKTALYKNDQHFCSEPAANNRDIVKGFCVKLSIQDSCSNLIPYAAVKLWIYVVCTEKTTV